MKMLSFPVFEDQFEFTVVGVYRESCTRTTLAGVSAKKVEAVLAVCSAVKNLIAEDDDVGFVATCTGHFISHGDFFRKAH